MPRPLPKELIVEEVELEDLEHDNEPTTEWRKKAEFRASVTGAHINSNGEVSITIKVPNEDKYLALPLTDVRSILMVFSAYEPVQVQKADLDKVWAGE